MKRRRVFLFIASLITVLWIVVQLPRDGTPSVDGIGQDRKAGRPRTFAHWITWKDGSVSNAGHAWGNILINWTVAWCVPIALAWFFTRSRNPKMIP